MSLDLERQALRALENRAAKIRGVLDSKLAAAAAHEADVKALADKSLHLEKVQKVLMHLMEKRSRNDLGSLDSLVTYGLKTVFPDQDVSMKSVMVDSGKKIYIDMTTYDGGEPAARDQHGSASVIESFLLRVLCLLKTGGPRLLLLDEMFGAVETDRINNVGRLLESLAKKLKIDMLLVTHNPGVSDATMFRATLAGGNRLVLHQEGGHKLHVQEPAAEAAPVLVGGVAAAAAAPKKTRKKKVETP